MAILGRARRAVPGSPRCGRWRLHAVRVEGDGHRRRTRHRRRGRPARRSADVAAGRRELRRGLLLRVEGDGPRQVGAGARGAERADELFKQGFKLWQGSARTGRTPRRTSPPPATSCCTRCRHLLITAVSLECGYAASSIRERIYVGAGGCGILLYTALARRGGLPRRPRRGRPPAGAVPGAGARPRPALLQRPGLRRPPARHEDGAARPATWRGPPATAASSSPSPPASA